MTVNPDDKTEVDLIERHEDVVRKFSNQRYMREPDYKSLSQDSITEIKALREEVAGLRECANIVANTLTDLDIGKENLTNRDYRLMMPITVGDILDARAALSQETGT